MQELGRTVRTSRCLQMLRREGGRQEHARAAAERRQAPRRIDRHLAREHGQQVACIVAPHPPLALRHHLVERKIIAAHEPPRYGIRCGYRRDWLDRAEPCDGIEPGLDVQWPRLAVRTRAVPVEEPVGDVARLLNLRHEQPGADRMHGAGGDEDTVAAPRLERVQHLRAAARTNRRLQFRLAHALVQARIDPAAGRGIDHIPGLGLATIGGREPCGPGVVGMHLHGKVPLRIEKLEEQWERPVPRMPSEQVDGPVADEPAERRAGQRPGGNDALIGAVIDDFPRLGEVVSRRQLTAEHRGEPPAAPEVAAVDGIERQRRQHAGCTRVPGVSLQRALPESGRSRSSRPRPRAASASDQG